MREALKKDPGYTPARFYLAQCLAAEGKCAEMEKELKALGSQGKGPSADKVRARCKSPSR